MPRRKNGGGRSPDRNPGGHSRRLGLELDSVIEVQRRRRRPDVVDPALILRVRMSGALLENDWAAVGLTVLSHDEDRTLVLFSTSDDMQEFRRRLEAYGRGTLPGRVNPPFAGFIANIETIGDVEPRDRIGMRARESGLVEVEDFLVGQNYTVDIEIWDFGRRDQRDRKLDDIVAYAEAEDGQELDRHVGPNLTLLRLSCDGAVIRALLSTPEISEIDFPPVPDLTTANLVDQALGQLPELAAVPDDAPIIGILDSGINDHPLIEDILVGAIGVPDALGTADDHGHGTFVGGIATFGDLRGQLADGTLIRQARLCSAKVIDADGDFPDSLLVPTLMRNAITGLHDAFGCRIFVIALGDRAKLIEGGKVGPWAQALDELVRELDVVIIVAAGNRQPRSGLEVEEAVTDYPAYLTETENRLCEPAGGLNIVTVGALAHANGLSDSAARNVGIRPITEIFEPAPFSRAGPGVHGAIKPDFNDFGGTLIYNGPVAALQGGEAQPEAGIISLHYQYMNRLFATRSGTSHAAPLVAFKAAQLLNRFPDSSANLIRALLAGSADIPEEALRRMEPYGEAAVRAQYGHGRIDAEKAAFSDNARVILYAEDELAIDHFAVFQLPIPELYQHSRGNRTIRVSLAYDPPVRHTRLDYNGVSMGFRLIRGCTPDEIFEHFRSRRMDEGSAPEMPGRFNCKLEPGPTIREKSSLQTASVIFSRDIGAYGDTYYLVVRCSSGWAGEEGRQRFAVTVEISHEADIQLYEQIRQRLRIRQ